MTRTYAILEVSAAAYDEIVEKMRAAGYYIDPRVVDGELGIELPGIALVRGQELMRDQRASPPVCAHSRYVGNCWQCDVESGASPGYTEERAAVR